jgi:hypothetical protein
MSYFQKFNSNPSVKTFLTIILKNINQKKAKRNTYIPSK